MTVRVGLRRRGHVGEPAVEVTLGHPAQDGVGESRGCRTDLGPDQVDGGGHRGVRRHPGGEELVGAEPQRVEQRLVDLGDRSARRLGEDGVVAAPPAQRAVGELGGERGVASGQPGPPEQPGKHEVGVGVLLGDGPERLERGPAGRVDGATGGGAGLRPGTPAPALLGRPLLGRPLRGWSLIGRPLRGPLRRVPSRRPGRLLPGHSRRSPGPGRTPGPVDGRHDPLPLGLHVPEDDGTCPGADEHLPPGDGGGHPGPPFLLRVASVGVTPIGAGRSHREDLESLAPPGRPRPRRRGAGPHQPVDGEGRRRPVDPGLLHRDLRREGDPVRVLRPRLQRAVLDPVERRHQETGPGPGQSAQQVTGGVTRPDGLGEHPVHRPGVHPPGPDQEGAGTGHLVPRQQGPLDGRRATPRRQQGEVQVDPAASRDREGRGGDHRPVGDDGAAVDGESGEGLEEVRLGRPLRLQDGEPVLVRPSGDGGPALLPPAPRPGVGAGDHREQLVPGPGERVEGRDGDLRRPGEDQPHRSDRLVASDRLGAERRPGTGPRPPAAGTAGRRVTARARRCCAGSP